MDLLARTWNGPFTQHFPKVVKPILVGYKIRKAGWWFKHLEKYEFVNGKDDIPYIMENKKWLKPPTGRNQLHIILVGQNPHSANLSTLHQAWLHPVWIRASSISNDTLLREPKMTNLGSTYYRFWESGMAWGESNPYSRTWMQAVSLFWFQ